MAWTLQSRLGLRLAVLLAVMAAAAVVMFVNFYKIEVARRQLDREQNVLRTGVLAAGRLEDLSLGLGRTGEKGRLVQEGLTRVAGRIKTLGNAPAGSFLSGDSLASLANLSQMALLMADPTLPADEQERQSETLRLEAKEAAGRLADALGKLEIEARADVQSLFKQQFVLLAVALGSLLLLAVGVLLPLARGVLSQRRELARTRETLAKLATIDPLTKTYNRKKLREVGQLEIERAKRYHAPLSAMLIDVDGYRSHNAALGYEGGDRMLADLADLLRRSIRVTDMLFRWRGGRFLVLAPHIEEDQAAGFAEKLRLAAESAELAPGRSVTISLGYGELQPGEDLDAFILRLKAALSRAQANGKSQCAPADHSAPA
ncbi:MAG: diguanylate cyclase [Desulfovibrionales bacterium]|nr:diguanylate cyclase [Desulfovibrionales bacterium]